MCHLADPQPGLWSAQSSRLRLQWYNRVKRVQAPQGWRHGVRSRSLGGTHVATLCNYSDKEGSISVPGIDPSCDSRSKTQPLTNIENDLYQRKTAILIPRYSAVWVAVFDSSAQPTARRFGDMACHEEESNHPCRHCNPNVIHRPNGLGISKDKQSRPG
jgi:hypothetical protein